MEHGATLLLAGSTSWNTSMRVDTTAPGLRLLVNGLHKVLHATSPCHIADCGNVFDLMALSFAELLVTLGAFFAPTLAAL